jgi:heme exporter protein C
MRAFLASLASPTRFRRWSGALLPWLWGGAGLLLAGGLGWGLLLAPPDWQQGETVRILYVHVPAAWLAMGGWTALALAALAHLVWRDALAGEMIPALARTGAVFTAVCLATGALWGRPMWGAWWVWDARLTSVLVLFFLWLGVLLLAEGFDARERGQRAAAVLALAGTVNLPVVKFSVDWWNTLHQPASIMRLDAPAIHASILWPLLVSAAGFLALFWALALWQVRVALEERRLERLRLRLVQEAGDGG